MKVLILLLSMLAIAAKECVPRRVMLIPPCVQQKIDSIKAQPKWNPPAQVDEYVFRGKRVFAFSSNCCDQFNPVYDENCNYLCAPSGGITGKGDLQCADFATEAKHVRLVWKDER